MTRGKDNAFDILFRDIQIVNARFVGQSGHTLEFIDGYGEKHRTKVIEGIDGLACFEYKGAHYYLNNILHNGDIVLHAYRVCKDGVISATAKDLNVYNTYDFKFEHFIKYRK